MSHIDYHAALSSKVTGTSNLHYVSLETKQPISFFTMLSSISGVIGQKGRPTTLVVMHSRTPSQSIARIGTARY